MALFWKVYPTNKKDEKFFLTSSNVYGLKLGIVIGKKTFEKDRIEKKKTYN